MSIAKPSEVIQRESESPSEFCRILCEAYRLYTPIDPAPGEGNGTPLQYSCLENPMDGETWWAAVYGVAQSQT